MIRGQPCRSADVVYKSLLLSFDLTTINNLCASSKTLHDICQNDDFWQQKFIQDFPNISRYEDDTWQKSYEHILHGKEILTKIKISTNNNVLVYDTNVKLHEMDENDNVSFVRDYINDMIGINISYQSLYVISYESNNKFYVTYFKYIDTSRRNNYINMGKKMVGENDLIEFLYILNMSNIKFDMIRRSDIKYEL